MIPQAIQDALNAAIASKTGLDTATAAEQTTAAAVVSAQAADQAAKDQLKTAQADLAVKYQALLAAEAAFFQPA